MFIPSCSALSSCSFTCLFYHILPFCTFTCLIYHIFLPSVPFYFIMPFYTFTWLVYPVLLWFSVSLLVYLIIFCMSSCIFTSLRWHFCSDFCTFTYLFHHICDLLFCTLACVYSIIFFLPFLYNIKMLLPSYLSCPFCTWTRTVAVAVAKRGTAAPSSALITT